MTAIDRAKSVVIGGFRRLPSAATRRVPGRPLRARLLRFHAEVLRVHPIVFDDAPTRYGFVLAGTTADLLQRNVYLFGVWEPHISRWVRDFLSPGDAVVDVGANVGYFSLLCATKVGPAGRVIAFEPVPTIVETLHANLALNDVQNVTVEPVIASDEAGTAEIFRGDPANLGQSTTDAGGTGVSEGEVRKVRAADLIAPEVWPVVRLVKVDTEGDDLRALRGLEPLLRAMGPGAAAVVEITPEDLAARGQTPRELVAFMQDVGFGVMLGVANSYESTDYAREDPQVPVVLRDAPDVKMDVIFLKPEPSAGERSSERRTPDATTTTQHLR